MDDLYNKLAKAELEIANGDEGVDFFIFSENLRKEVVGSGNNPTSAI